MRKKYYSIFDVMLIQTQIFTFLKGINNHNTCRSLISYQSVVDCGSLRAGCAGSQWYCTRGTYKQVSGSCAGDSGGPSWTFRQGKIWKSITNSIYPNFRIYWDNSCCYSWSRRPVHKWLFHFHQPKLLQNMDWDQYERRSGNMLTTQNLEKWHIIGTSPSNSIKL